jgi:hypothetical protein
MLTLQDCLALCELTDDEVDAIAEHEHIPEIAAVELGNYLVVRSDGRRRIKQIILDDIAAALSRGNRRHALKLELVLKMFCDTHPERPAAQA